MHPIRSILVVLAAAALVPAAASAATINVTTTADPDNGTGDCLTTDASCSLREAVNAGDTSPGSTVAVPPGDYTLDNSLGTLDVSKSMTITGAGARLTHLHMTSGMNIVSILTLEPAAAGTATVSGLSLSGATAQYAVFALGQSDSSTETLRDVAIVDNHTTGAPAGLYANGGHVVIDRSTIAGNTSGGPGTAAAAAGVFVGQANANLTITDSTIADNTAGDAGNGTASHGAGLGVTAPTTVVNSTIADNKALGAGSEGGNVEVTHNATLTLSNTIIAGGAATFSRPDCNIESGSSVVSSGGNLLAAVSSECGVAPPHDVIGSDPGLGALADNGGPTDTMAIGPTSPALDVGAGPGCPSTDQRGAQRPSGPACDAGAFEFQYDADLSAASGPATASVPFGGTAPLTVSVANAGVAATAVTLTETLAPGLALVSATAPGGVCSQAGQVVTCPLGSLAAGAGATATIVVRGTAAGPHVATASVTGGLPDPNPANNRAASTVTVGAPPLSFKCRVPKVRGKSLTAAKKAIRKAGCRLGRVKRPKRRRHHKLGRLVVVHQTAPGSLLPPGAKVSLTLGKKRKR